MRGISNGERFDMCVACVVFRKGEGPGMREPCVVFLEMELCEARVVFANGEGFGMGEACVDCREGEAIGLPRGRGMYEKHLACAWCVFFSRRRRNSVGEACVV